MTRKMIALAQIIFLTSLIPGVAAQSTPDDVAKLLDRSYLDLLESTPQVSLSSRQMNQVRKQLQKEQQTEERRLREEEKRLQSRIKQLRQDLSELNKKASQDTPEMAERRRELHCQILQLEDERRRTETERKQGVPVAFANKLAKLELIEKWPTRHREIQRAVETGKARERRFGDVEDIGVRTVGSGQEKDIRLGEESIRQMRAYGLLPPEVEDEQVKNYIERLTARIAANSDLKVPAKVTLLDSPEINAFALPGGFFFINRGLVERAETESELAGVIAHEIAHAAARHGARLMKRATIANIIYQSAQIAAIVFTGGVVGIGTYYALQYGFFGLGMVLDLALLGVSREYEAEADQLGVQYLWRAGYTPQGFINFFDKMASEKGYVRSASFFRTHPPFFDRIVATFSEIEFLPAKENLVIDSSEFRETKRHLEQWVKEKQKRPEEQAPTLKRMPQCDQETKELVIP